MKKLLSVMMALIFLWLAMPLDVLAEAIHPLPTSQELSAAVALTGLSKDTPGYRSGMKPSESMNAMQLAGWIHEFQKQKLDYIMDTFENYDVELAYVLKTIRPPLNCSGAIPKMISAGCTTNTAKQKTCGTRCIITTTCW